MVKTFKYEVVNVQFWLPSNFSDFSQMEMERFELLTPCLQGRCSPS